MAFLPRPLAFSLAATDQGTLIVNRFDYRDSASGPRIGVGHMLLSRGSYDTQEVETVAQLLHIRRRHFGDGVVVLDGGANIGVFTVEWAKVMRGWGWVIGVEAQERVYYALAGNIAINNCFNARAIHAALAGKSGTMRIPTPNYRAPGTFGSLELKPSEHTEDIGQTISYADEDLTPVAAIAIDSIGLGRLDLLKIDVEGMEVEVLEGARGTIERCLPIIVVEKIKSDHHALTSILDSHGYRRFDMGMNIMAIHHGDPTLQHFVQAPRPG